MRLPYVAKVDLVKEWLEQSGPIVVQEYTTRFHRGQIGRTSWSRKKSHMIDKEELLNTECHVWLRIILLSSADEKCYMYGSTTGSNPSEMKP
ncbi:hypothetical protein TNCV_1761481 [Trichonephila clavipes]|nr:hypothetical protein TNCV_1761481 [Trichonephila clavipes]